MHETNLHAGDYDGTSFGDVNIWGLDDYGNNAGISEYWGVGLGAGISTAGAILTRWLWKSPSGYKWAEGIGFLSGLLTGVTMLFFGKTRRAGWVALISSLPAAARQIEMLVSGEAKAMEMVDAAVQQGSLGVVTIEPTAVIGVQGANHVVAGVNGASTGFGLPTIEPSAVVRGHQMGAVPQAHLVGAGGPQMPQLVGAPQGGISGLSKHFGSTITG